jgi:cytochrome c oxidase assembly protein subunit 11
MVGMAYASVPLYQLFCQVTGYGGTTQRAAAAGMKVLDKTSRAFDANTMAWLGLPAVQREVELKIGEHDAGRLQGAQHIQPAVTGTATFNVTPQAAGPTFQQDRVLLLHRADAAAGRVHRHAGRFFIDPDIVDDPTQGH